MSEISVIVPIYKVELYLRRCIKSILNQTFIDFEVILIDDGSPDNCGQICDEYAKLDSRVYVIHQQNSGLSAARNAGLDWVFAHSNSKWITFIDSDDWVHPEMLQCLYNSGCSLNMPISICGYYETEGENISINSAQMNPKIWKTEDFYLNKNLNATVAWGKLYRKECFFNIRYPEGKLHEDEFVTYKVLFEYPKIVAVEAPLYAYFQNVDGIMKSEWNPRRLDALEAIDMQISFFKKRSLHDLCKNRVRAYVAVAIRQYKQSNASDLITKNGIWFKWKIVQKYLIYRKKNVWNRNEIIYIKEFLFPHLMNYYWIMNAVINKIKKEGIGVAIKSIISRLRKL